MPELRLHRSGDTLTVELGEYTTSVPFAEIMPKTTTWRHIYEDAPAYGRELFEKTFCEERMRSLLTTMPTNERLVLVTNDPRVALIPWEYLRDQNNKLLASRLNFVRSITEAQRKESFPFAGPLEIVAIPVSPVDEPQVLNTEREWRRLVEAVSITTPPKALTLKRVRPPTLTQMERALNSQATTIIHFMGHSTSHEGKGLLAFEDSHARSQLVDATDFNDALDAHVFLVMLNSCLSAIVATTEFGNIAQALIGRGIPYALGMQFVVPDDAALELSRALYDFLLQGRTVEEAVRRTRRALEQDTTFPNAAWLAGIPVLYTNLREPAAPIPLSEGRPTIQPDPERLEKICDLTALPQAEHFVGRGKEIGEALDALLSHHAPGFVLLHGLGGIGKTATARAIAERIGWYYQDRVLSISFETFASLDSENQLTVNEQFADRFYNRLARFYKLDPAQYPAAIDLQQAILQRRTRLRSLLILDNIETLVDAQKRKHSAAEALASFISRLKEGDGAILLTSRIVPPPDWGECEVVYLSGLSEEAGAELFLALLPADHAHLAPKAPRLALSKRVQGHPLSIRLLAGRFAEETGDLATFLTHIEAELEIAEQATPASLEDPNRQKTLYACMDYSVKRLTSEQRNVLDAVSIFQAPFLPEFATQILNDEEHTPVHLQNLVRLGLLTMEVRTFAEGELVLLELHPMLRWYIQHYLSEPDTALLERYGEVYLQLAQQSYEPEGGYDRSSRMRYLMRQSLPDCEAALLHLPPARRSALAYYLAMPYTRSGQNRHALALYEQALEVYQQSGDVQWVSVTQNAMANVLVDLGKPQEAMALYQQALLTKQQLGDVREVAVTQNAMADVLVQLGKPQEALALYQQALLTYKDLGDVRSVSVAQANFSQLLLQQEEYERALSMAWDAYTGLNDHGYTRDTQIMQQLLISIKGRTLGPERFDMLWQQVMSVPQPAWLRDVQESAPTEDGSLPSETLDTIVSNTTAVMTVMPDKHDEWRETMTGALKQAQDARRTQDAEFFTAVLAILDDQAPALPDGHPYSPALNMIQAGIAAGEPEGEDSSDDVSEELVQAVRDFVNAKDWDATRQVVETRQAMLFRPVVEGLFERNIAQAKADGEERAASLLEQHLTILRTCKAIGIAETFEQFASLEEDSQEDALPFDPELIPRSIAALLGGPQEKMAHAQYLMALANETTDEALKSLIQVLQLALFSNDLSQLGGDLKGAYRQAWEAIITGVKAGGVDPEMLEIIASNTVAVLGPAAAKRSEWRDNLAALRNQATTKGDRNMLALLNAVIGLLDAGGDASGLGDGLTGVYEKTWLAIVEKLQR